MERKETERKRGTVAEKEGHLLEPSTEKDIHGIVKKRGRREIKGKRRSSLGVNNKYKWD